MVLAVWNVTNALINWFLDGLTAAFDYLPDWNPIAGFTDGLNASLTAAAGVFELTAWLNHYVPVVEAAQLLSLLMVFHAAGLIFHLVTYVLSALHILGESTARA